MNLKTILLGFLLLSSASGCKKTTSLTSPPKTEEEQESPETQLLPVKIERGKALINLKYLDDKPVLTEITYPNGEVAKLIYTKTGYLSRLEHYKNNKIVQYFSYALDTEFRISKIQSWNLKDESFSLSHQYTLAYDKQHGINNLKKYDLASDLLEEKILDYSAQGNPVAITLIKKSTSKESIWAYDDRAGIFSNLPYASLLFLEQENQDICMGKNNPLSSITRRSPSENQTFSYTYNNTGYPSEIIRKKGSISETIKITYKAIKRTD
ncbi:hypothetical protein [Pedobacter steynii]|uniref:Uncharacterized protein n=1 Tax=Pedobacter steynii TaxID=430522 RepID=A0A1D7QBV8_9SPHI|nr:hypothetical protein [Pedobacter steynii]AOM76161.1 hypothetical protein BFS30_02660 [Pedobacter steynii]